MDAATADGEKLTPELRALKAAAFHALTCHREEWSALAGLGREALGELDVAVVAVDKVVRFTPEQIATSGSPTPDVELAGADLAGPSGLAFDAAGNLWVAYFSSNVVARLTPADQAGSGAVTLTPAVQITLDVGALLDGLAFDEGGGLWTPYSSGKLARLVCPGASGTVTPATILASPDLGSAKVPAMFPPPAGVPLHPRIP